MRIACRNRIMAFACIICSVRRDAAKLLIRWDLAEQVWQHRGVPNAATRHLDRADLQRFLIDPNVDLAPQAALWTAMLAGIPLSFAFSLNACAVDKQVKWSC